MSRISEGEWILNRRSLLALIGMAPAARAAEATERTGSPMSVTDFVPPPQGRLTLTSGVAVTTTNMAGQTTVFYTPYSGNRVPVYDGTEFVAHLFTELSLLLDPISGHTNYHAAGQLYDFFIVNDAGVLRLGTGPKWGTTLAGGSDRGTGAETTEIELFGGLWVNKNSMTLRFGDGSGDTLSIPAKQATLVGTGCLPADGMIDDSQAKRYLANAYNKVMRPMYRNETATSYTYSSTTLRQANGNAANKVSFVVSLPGDLVDVSVIARANSNTADERPVIVGLGLNQTTSQDAVLRFIDTASNAKFAHPWANWKGYAPEGLNYVAWLESAYGTDTQTWFVHIAQGMNGTVMA